MLRNVLVVLALGFAAMSLHGCEAVEKAKDKANEKLDAAKKAAADAKKAGQEKLENAKTSAQEALDATKAKAEAAQEEAQNKFDAAKKSAQEQVADAQAKLDAAKGDAKEAAQKNLEAAKKAAENAQKAAQEKLDKAKAEVEAAKQKANAAKDAAMGGGEDEEAETGLFEIVRDTEDQEANKVSNSGVLFAGAGICLAVLGAIVSVKKARQSRIPEEQEDSEELAMGTDHE